jgi:hypothetical protein
VLVRLKHGWEEGRGVVESWSSSTMVQEVGLVVTDTLVLDVVISCRTVPVEDREEVGTKEAARLVPVVDSF